MENLETKSGFKVARLFAITLINLLVLASLVVFVYIQSLSNRLADLYVTCLNSSDQGTSVLAVLRTVFPF